MWFWLFNITVTVAKHKCKHPTNMDKLAIEKNYTYHSMFMCNSISISIVTPNAAKPALWIHFFIRYASFENIDLFFTGFNENANLQVIWLNSLLFKNKWYHIPIRIAYRSYFMFNAVPLLFCGTVRVDIILPMFYQKLF